MHTDNLGFEGDCAAAIPTFIKPHNMEFIDE